MFGDEERLCRWRCSGCERCFGCSHFVVLALLDVATDKSGAQFASPVPRWGAALTLTVVV